MSLPSIISLRPPPNARTAADFRAAIDRVAVADAAAQTEMAAIEADRGRLLLEAEAREIAATDRRAGELVIYRQQLAALTAKLRTEAAAAEDAEAVAMLAAERDAITDEAREIAVDFLAAYPRAVAVLTPLLLRWHRNNLRRENHTRSLMRERHRSGAGTVGTPLGVETVLQGDAPMPPGHRLPLLSRIALPALPADADQTPHWSVLVDQFVGSSRIAFRDAAERDQ